MDFNFVYNCFFILGFDIDEVYFKKYSQEIVQFLEEKNNGQDIRFDIYHQYEIVDEKGNKKVENDLTLFETVNRLEELNANVSSYEWYTARIKN